MTAILIPHKKLIPLFVAFLAVWGTAVSCSDLSEQDSRQIDEALNDSLTSTTETWDLDMSIIENGQKKVRVTGSYAATYKTEELNETRIRGPVHIDVFDSTGTVTTIVNSNRAIYRAQDSEFEFFGDVRVNSNDEHFLESEYLKWEQGSNRISTPEFVIITTPADSIAGSGFEGTTDLANYTITEPTGRFTVD